MNDYSRPAIALVVPSLYQGGGVPAVARFVKDAILSSDQFDLRLVSLAMSSRDAASVNVSQPKSWFRGVTTTTSGEWEGLPYIHVGAIGGELEFQRLQPRKALTRALAGCDIIQVVCGSPAWANAVCGLGKPVALQCATRALVERKIRDSELKGIGGWWRKKMTAATDRLDDKALQSVDAIQVENPWMFEYAQKINGGRNVDLRYAPPGVDIGIFHPLTARVPDSDPYILCVARMNDKRKNIGLLLDAYSRLPQSLIDRVRLVLAGSAAPPDQFWNRVEGLGLKHQVSFLERPSSQELVSLYQKASVFALSSDEEGLGVVLLEAMACGTPVVSTRSGGPDGIIADGKDGFLVALDDASQMANRLQILLTNNDLNLKMGLEARKTVELRYCSKITGAVFVDMWNRLLEPSKQRSVVGSV